VDNLAQIDASNYRTTRFYAFRRFEPAVPMASVSLTEMAVPSPASERKRPFRIRVKVIRPAALAYRLEERLGSAAG